MLGFPFLIITACPWTLFCHTCEQLLPILAPRQAAPRSSAQDGCRLKGWERQCPGAGRQLAQGWQVPVPSLLTESRFLVCGTGGPVWRGPQAHRPGVLQRWLESIQTAVP